MSAHPLTIHAIRPRAVDAPLARPITTAVASIPSAPLLLLDVQTTEGIVGSAYVLAYTPMALKPMAELAANLSDYLAGKTASPHDRAAELAGTFRLLGRQGLTGMVLSGIDMALWDALGKAHDVSVARLLGGEERPIPAYDSFGIVQSKRDVQVIEKSVASGFDAIKIKIGGGDLKQDVHAVRQVRDAIGPDTRLMVDYNQSLSVPEAIHRISVLTQFDLHWVEEPVPAEDLVGHAKVRAAASVPIQTGENWWYPNGAAQAIAAGASDHAMLDMMKIGGITGWMRTAALAEAAALPVSSHAFIDASAHALTTTPNAHYLEHLETTNAVLKTPLTPQNGAISPSGPGLGIEWDEAAVRKYAI